jgi:hypothetical protein
MRPRTVVCSFVSFVSFVSLAFAQMPDPKQMSGVPLPVGDLSPGTVTARVIRGQLSNPIDAQAVELTGAGAARTEKTDNSGRATFTGLTPGSRVKLRATVGSEAIESQEFDVPAAGGIRVMLVATDPNAARQQAEAATLAKEPPVPGSVVFGPESRFVIEIGDDALNVFNMLQLTNTGSRAVQTAPVVFDLPKGAVGVGMMEGSTPNAVAAGNKVSVSGPFPPGNTVVQFGYSIPLGSDTIDIEQKLPADLPQVSVVVQKLGAMQMASPQIAQRREMSAEGGSYIVGQGPALKAGSVLQLTLSGLPSRPSWPRNIAVTLAVVVLLAGVYGATRRPRGDESRPGRGVHNRREKLFAELTSLEAQRRKGAVDAETYAARRESLVTALEDLYRGLDETDGKVGSVREVA